MVRSLPSGKAAAADGKVRSVDRTRTVLGVVNARPRNTLVAKTASANHGTPLEPLGKALNSDLMVEEAAAPDLKRSQLSSELMHPAKRAGVVSPRGTSLSPREIPNGAA